MEVDTAKRLFTVGNYELVEKVAEGGMGAVYRARHKQTGQIVALKIMPPHMAANPVLLKRFEQEFRAASKLDHPNIVRAIDYGESGGSPFLAMEFVEGESLGKKLDREGAIPEDEAIRIIVQVAQGLHRAHKVGLVHRDVKPDNILLSPDGVAKLADLGLVKETETDLNLTKTGRGLGTPHFMAPEQFRNAKGVDSRCDIYSLGATLYQMVTGQLPFASCNGPLDAWMKKIHNELEQPRKLVPTLSERANWAILHALHINPEGRPATCREFVEELTGQISRKVVPSKATAAVADLWYLIYRDEEGTLHTVKGSTQAIRRTFGDGLLGDASNVRASRSKTGNFQPLLSFTEFRDLEKTSAGKGSRSSGEQAIPPAISPSQPHINFPTAPPPQEETLGWLGETGKWVLLILLMFGTGVAAFLLMNWLKIW
jgi:serine/threonine protein kinase